MKCTSAPAIDDEQLYKDVTDARATAEADLLDQLEVTVFSRYAVYADNRALCDKATWNEDDHHVLHSNWDALRGASFADVRPEIFATTGGFCVLCGNSKAGEIDHYLPRSVFPEFSILTLNLVPACNRCNNRKRSRYRSSPPHLYVHPYLMSLPNEPFLSAHITIGETVEVVFQIVKTSTMGDDVFKTLTTHFADLLLANFYQDEAIQHMAEQRGAYYGYYRDGGRTSLQKYLLREATSVSQVLGTNHWKPALLRSLAASTAFCSGGFTKLGAEIFID